MTPHLTTDELVRWRDRGSAADRDRVVGHLASCDTCGAAYSEVLDTEPIDAPAARPDAPEFVARGIALGPGGGRARPLRTPVLALAASVALAAVSVALVPGLRRAIVGGPSAGGEAVRGTTVLLLRPVGDVPPPLEFEWRSPIHAARYRVEVRDAEGRPLGSLTTTIERVAVPADLLATLRPGGRYEWTATALDERGAPLLSSRPATFRILAPPEPSR